MTADCPGTTPSANPDLFRTLLGRFASGVTVATALDDAGNPIGMTASAIASVSLEPPLLLICVNHGDRLHDVLLRVPRFALNVLADDQEALSQRFAGPVAQRFNGTAYRSGPNGVPLLDGALAHILCEYWDVIPAGDHSVFIGRVTGGSTFDRRPLVHFKGGYTTVGRET